MAVIKSLILGACAIASIVNAAPVMFTVTDIVTQTHWTTIDCTTTIWRNIKESPAPTSVSVAESTSTAAPVVIPTSTQAPVVPISTTSVYVAPVTTTTPVATTAAPVTTTAAPVITTAAPVTTVSSPVVNAVATPQPSVSSAAPVASAGSFVTASSSGTCEGKGTACVGEITHWDGGLGACGWNVDTANDLSIALPVGFMGSASNSNPYCGRSVTLLNPANGMTVTAKVGDKCMGCVDRAIDCTDKLFSAITNGQGDGRVSGIQWWLN